MRRAWDLTWRYRLVAVTLLVGVVGLVLWLVGLTEAVRWTFSAYAVVIAGWEAVLMVRQMLRRRFGLDVLALAAIASTVMVGEYVAAFIVVLMLTGGAALEDYAESRARRELDALLSRSPRVAHRLEAGLPRDVPVGDVAIGDVLVIRPAEVVPVDGELLSAEAVVDASSLTGESLPVTLERGASMLSGEVNGGAAVEIRATATAADSQYEQIVLLVQRAQESRAPVVRLADRYAVPFTLLAFLIAGLAWAISGRPERLAEVLVLATPCPLLIAAPVAFVGGMSRASRRGILVRGGGVLEQLARARSAVFDKTGTITMGRPEVVALVTGSGFTETGLLRLAASAEQFSSHVLASSVLRAAADRGVRLEPAEHAEEVTANGVVASVGGQEVAVGKYGFIASRAPEAERVALEPGQLAIYVEVDGRFAGAVIAEDVPRDNAAGVIAELRAMGLRRQLMLTGDARVTADHVAAAVGLEPGQVRADCLPGDKVAVVAELPERPVIMVGDGVNDAPVLAAAEVGVAMGARGATAASESAGAVILVDDLSRVVDAVRIGRATVRIALQSIWLGIAVSVVLMVIAAFGVIPATVGAISQEAVDVATILASLRAIGPRTERRAAPAISGPAPRRERPARGIGRISRRSD